MSYLLNRIRSTTRHVLSPRGLLLAVGCLTAIAAVFARGGASQLLALISTAAVALLLLLISERQTANHKLLSSVRDRAKVPDGETSHNHRPTPTATPAGHLATARPEIRSARNRLDTSPSGAMGSESKQAKDDEAGPTTTIVVPCYNETRFLAAALESVRHQSFTDWECIVVDDASTDRSVIEAHRFTNLDERFRLARHKTNAGLSAARNTGLRMARGRYITFLDADDMLMVDSLIDRVEALDVSESATAGAFCGIQIVPESKDLESLPPHEHWHDRGVVDFVSAAGECPFNAHAPLVRTNVVRMVGGFDEAMRDGAEDWDLWLRILRLGYNFVPSKWRTAVYRQKQSSMAKDGAVGHVAEAGRQIRRAYNADPSVSSFPDAPHPFPNPLPFYQEQLVHARRTLQYAATAIAGGNEAAATAILSENGVAIETWMGSHFDFDDTINAGFRRALGLTTQEIGESALELADQKARLNTLIEASQKQDEPVASPTANQRWRHLFVPQNAAQAQVMIRIASEAERDSFAFLNLERVSGAQGAQALVAETGFPSYSLNEWVLNGHQHRNLVVAAPHGSAVEELIAVTVARGGRTAEVLSADDEIMLVDAAPRYDHKVEKLSPSDVGAWLAAADSPSISVAGSNSRAMLWHGITDPDPDTAFALDEYPDTVFDASVIERFRNIHAGERCVIIGNGPSLNDIDLRMLKHEYTFAVNGIFHAAEQMGFDPSYYVVEDNLVMRDNLDAIRDYRADNKLFPSIYRDEIGPAANVTYFMMDAGYYVPDSPSFCVPRFSTDASQRVYSGQSVTTINLQLAYYMGFTEVVMIGMDFSYTVPEESQIDGAHILSQGDDPNHFHPDYFGRGKTWKDPKLDRVLASYQLAKLIYEADGRRIVNATADGNLELFERVAYGQLFG